MLRKLLRTNLQSAWSCQKQARLSELREYLCLRENLNNQAADKATADFKSLSEKYNLDGPSLIQLFAIINYDVKSFHKYFTPEQAAYEREEISRRWRNSPFYDPSSTLDVAIQELQRKYPDVLSYTLNQPERARALRELEQIFVNAGPQVFVPGDDQRVTRFLKEFERGINGLINTIQKELPEGASQSIHEATQVAHKEASERIIDVLTEVYRKLEERPSWAYARIRLFLDSHREGRGLITETQQSQYLPSGRSLEEGSIPSTQVADPLSQGDDLPSLIEAENNAIRERYQFNFLPWVNDQKPIFEAAASRVNVSWFRALSYLATGYLLYKLYQGDATTLSLIGLVAVSGFCFYKTHTGNLRNSLNYLVQMNINKNGQSLDLFVKNGQNKITKIEGVPVRDFKLHRGDYEFTFENSRKESSLAKFGATGSKVKLSQIRKFGIATDAWVATYGKEVVFVPHNYQGNGPILEQIFNGTAPQFSH